MGWPEFIHVLSKQSGQIKILLCPTLPHPLFTLPWQEEGAVVEWMSWVETMEDIKFGLVTKT